ncbi:WYL domain-containing protein [Methylobacter sp. G7]|uniref:helix-turn-helix transcriptional regulator n=1 Tax=Methylobacter sp. G7 TaxID=3230117 RepID=UPI003D8097C9
MDTILRYFEMLRFIPKEPASISTPDLQKRLQDNGYKIDLRTVQRDLNKLSASGLFPFTSTEDTKPLSWFWPKETPRLQLPLMTADEALTFKLVETFLESLLPPSIRMHMAEYFQLADNTLKASPLACWIDKVRIIPNGLSLLPAEIDSVVLPVIYEALLKNCRFDATYQGRKSVAKTYEMSPLGLVFRNNVIYLVATIGDYSDIKQFALHRFKYAKMGEKEIAVPVNFKLDEYIAQGEFDYPIITSHQDIALKIKITKFMSTHLFETPLSKNQHITELENDMYLLAANVKDSDQLRWWIRSFSTHIEVLEPLELRAKFAQEARALGEMYR